MVRQPLSGEGGVTHSDNGPPRARLLEPLRKKDLVSKPKDRRREQTTDLKRERRSGPWRNRKGSGTDTKQTLVCVLPSCA